MENEDRAFLAEIIAERVAGWPKAALDELLKAVNEIEMKYVGPYVLSDDERAAVQEGLAQAKRGEFVPDEVMADFFRRYGSKE